MGNLNDVFGAGGAESSIASFIFLINIPLGSQKPCFVFPNEFGPDDVGVSLKKGKILNMCR